MSKARRVAIATNKINVSVTPYTNLIERCSMVLIEELENEKEVDVNQPLAFIKQAKALTECIHKILTNPTVIEAFVEVIGEIESIKENE